ncbi:MAG: lysophospholipase [Bacteroidetes bacterium]|nr:lysophospholipase [Bacteroidota bacterium]
MSKKWLIFVNGDLSPPFYYFHLLYPVKETEFKISYREGQSFSAREWSPDGEPRGVIVLIHGLSEHAGRYSYVGAFFAESGYTMIVADLRGHGMSFGKRGHFPSIARVMDDITLFIEEARKRHPGLPLFLYGHSMGGNFVLNYLIRNQPEVAAAVVTSPWLRLAFAPLRYKIILATIVNKVFPSMTQPDGVIPSLLSHDEEVCRKYIADPLVHSMISVRSYLEISLAGEYALKHAHKVASPLLLMHGDGDSLTSFAATEEFSKNLTCKHTFKPWKGLFHELHNEVEKETVLSFIKEWIYTI